MQVNKIHNIDCFTGLNQLSDDYIDLIVTSPPYNVDLGNNKYNKNPYDMYNDNLDHKDYLSWLESVFAICYRKLKSGGRVCINIGDGKNGAVPTSSDIIQFMCGNLKYIPMTHIIWNKQQASSRTAWGSFNLPSSPSFPTPFEHILVFAKESRKLSYKGVTDLIKKEFIDWSLALWTIAPENRQKQFGHPAMFPEEIPRRLIKMFSWMGALVVDPFNGAGTTTKVARELGRNFIGFEISKEYCEIAESRLSLLDKSGVQHRLEV